MKLKQKFKKKLFSHEWDSMLRTGQQIMLIIQGICILIFFFYWDFTKKWLFQLLAAILAFAIMIIAIGMIWLLRWIGSFSDTYKTYYIAKHPDAAKWLQDKSDRHNSDNKTNSNKNSDRRGKNLNEKTKRKKKH